MYNLNIIIIIIIITKSPRLPSRSHKTHRMAAYFTFVRKIDIAAFQTEE